ncbi:hypothetical protein HPB51_012715 [Rhipicephalus microplus]|uniref:Uncharacterized protein n=1 Tax=Rhipicephalus microplus TaxID=6941 RepID=A0A9J6EH37_RHIMP|nr:hypothetical protein HPB51_012715 [Rhipicephalus microplus]
MAESADRKFRREINRRVNASFQLIDSEADVINDTRYVDRDSRNAERESDLPSEACAVDLEDGHRRLCVHDRERPSAHSSIVPETDVPQGHVLISGDACYPSGCSVSVPHDHTDFERRAFHDSSAAASTSATSQVRQRDSFELAPTGSNEEQVCERGSVDSLLAFRERLQAWALQSRASHTSVTSLLRVLQSHECFSALPSTARALLQTPKKCLEVLQLAGGKYHHFGLSAGLQRVLQDCAELPRILKLSFNIDEAVRRNFPETKKNDIECVIKVWLRHAGEKLQKQRLRTSRTHHEAPSDGFDIPKYTKSADNGPVMDRLNLIELHAAASSWSEKEMITNIIDYISGEASKIYFSHIFENDESSADDTSSAEGFPTRPSQLHEVFLP